MKLKVVWIGKTKEPAIQLLTDEYLQRLSRYVEAEGIPLKDETALLLLQRVNSGSRTKPVLILLDSKGKQLSSEELATFLGNHQDSNPAPLVFAIGPANGFGEETRKSGTMILSLGKMTIAHELARVLVLEQLYRAFTILRGHPYHLAH
jgi:23S rRNA (pseudouridine1915-N3)-methyltransferase